MVRIVSGLSSSVRKLFNMRTLRNIQYAYTTQYQNIKKIHEILIYKFQTGTLPNYAMKIYDSHRKRIIICSAKFIVENMSI